MRRFRPLIDNILVAAAAIFCSDLRFFHITKFSDFLCNGFSFVKFAARDDTRGQVAAGSGGSGRRKKRACRRDKPSRNEAILFKRWHHKFADIAIFAARAFLQSLVTCDLGFLGEYDVAVAEGVHQDQCQHSCANCHRKKTVFLRLGPHIADYTVEDIAANHQQCEQNMCPPGPGIVTAGCGCQNKQAGNGQRHCDNHKADAAQNAAGFFTFPHFWQVQSHKHQHDESQKQADAGVCQNHRLEKGWQTGLANSKKFQAKRIGKAIEQ